MTLLSFVQKCSRLCSIQSFSFEKVKGQRKAELKGHSRIRCPDSGGTTKTPPWSCSRILWCSSRALIPIEEATEDVVPLVAMVSAGRLLCLDASLLPEGIIEVAQLLAC